MKKQVLALALVLTMLFSLIPGAAAAPATPSVTTEQMPGADKIVTLDGDWHFKLYRT